MSGHLVRRQKETTNREQAASAKTVGSIVTQALKNSTKKMGVANTKALIARMKEGDPVAFKYCNYTIAKQVGEMLGLLDKNIKAVYVCEYDDATPEDACFCEARKPVSLIQLIIWVERKTKAVAALVAAIDAAIAEHYSRLFNLEKLDYVLDVHIIDDTDVRMRVGYGALLQSIYQPPIQVWNSGVSRD